jgi:LysM repeat protein
MCSAILYGAVEQLFVTAAWEQRRRSGREDGMAVALRELERDARRSPLRVIRTPVAAPVPRHVYWLRRALVLIIAAGLALGVVGVVRAVTAVPTEPVARTNLTVVVAPGQTLWDIAAQYVPADRDLTGWAAEIAAVNDVDAQALQPGTPLVIPLETAVVTARPDVGAPREVRAARDDGALPERGSYR